MKYFALTFSFILICFATFGQSEKSHIRQGNKQFEKGNFGDAETSYRKSLDENGNSFPGIYNLGNALYKQDKFEEASQQFEKNIAISADKISASQSHYNYGNALFKEEKYAESVEAYKNALRNNPKDIDARYNLAYAKLKLQEQEQNQQNQDQDKDQEKQEQEQQENQEENEDQQQENQEEQSEQNEEQSDQQQQQQQQAQQPKISKQDAERILNALKNDEQDLQEKLSRKQGQRIKIEKEW